jgi:hypothetical protein
MTKKLDGFVMAKRPNLAAMAQGSITAGRRVKAFASPARWRVGQCAREWTVGDRMAGGRLIRDGDGSDFFPGRLAMRCKSHPFEAARGITQARDAVDAEAV